MTGIYLQPIGLLYGEVARDAVSLGAALPLAGGPLAFSAVRLWEGEPRRQARQSRAALGRRAG